MYHTMLGYCTCLGFRSPPKSYVNFCYKPSRLYFVVVGGGGYKYLWATSNAGESKGMFAK